MSSKKFGSDVLVDVLKALDIKYLTLNPGSSTRGMHDSVVNYGGNTNPEMMLCCHEEIAVSIASGYFRATNKPLVVLLHDLAGLLHAPRAILDAWQHRDGLIILGGNGPLRIENRRAGTDWNQVAESPNLIVRSYVKWDSLPYSLVSAIESILKGYAIAGTKPAGPVYISLDTDMQEDEVDPAFRMPVLSGYEPLEIGEGSLDKLAHAAKLLASAQNPVIIAGRYGKSDESVSDLVKLSEEIGASVIDSGLRCNFPTNHPLNMTPNKKETLRNADVVLTLDLRNMYAELTEEQSHYERLEFEYVTRPDAKLIRIDAEGTYTNSWITDSGRLVPVSSTIVADGHAAVKKLLKLCADETSRSNNRDSINDRIAKLRLRTASQRKAWLDSAQDSINKSIINYASLSLVTWQSAKNRDWVISYIPGGISQWVQRIWDVTRWYQYPGTAGGTGCAIGRSIGVTLANEGRLSVNFQTDGDLLYSPSALWTISHFRLPMLVVMVNNHSYYNDEKHQHEMAVKRGRPIENKVIGIRIEDPYVDFSKLASAYDLRSSGPIHSIDRLREAVVEGIKSVEQDHKSYVVDAVVDMGT